MKKRIDKTPRSQVKQALRLLWLHSRERAAVLKAESYCCEECNIKQSKAKGREVAIEVHHRHGIGNWEKVIDLIFEELLCSPDNLVALCRDCHDKLHHDAPQSTKWGGKG